MLSVTGILGLGREGRKVSGGRESTSREPGNGQSCPWGPLPVGRPVFQVLLGNLPRGAGGCGWGISGNDGEAETTALCRGPAQGEYLGKEGFF